MQTIRNQKGLALLMLVFLIALVATGYTVTSLDSTELTQKRDKKTSAALRDAKDALLAFSAEPITAAPLATPLVCDDNCPRPGDLPCPDIDNDGIAETSCNTQVSRLGRLPWRTLGLGDLRDGSGERLWYAVSNQYKINKRVLPLNSESLGAISLKNTQGGLVYDAAVGTGLVAVVIAPGEALIRDGETVVQNRAAGASQLVVQNYLDVAFTEDNANFTDATTNGFISGSVRAADKKILNDVVLPITRAEINAVMEPRVLVEVMEALVNNICPVGQADTQNRTCISGVTGTYIPDPANINDPECLTIGTIPNDECKSDDGIALGRIPVGGNPSSPSDDNGWEVKNINSILRGESNHNWFQQNGWRELIFYAVAPICTQTSASCGMVGSYLTLENALTPPAAPGPSNKGLVIISAGSMLVPSPRNTADITSYLELENEDGSPLLPNAYSRYTHNPNRNDRVLSVP